MYRLEYIIAIDFDGTIVTHEYPNIGNPVPLAKEVIQMLISNGHKCFLWTMRDKQTLNDAIQYCKDNNIDMSGYNYSPVQFSDSPKQYAHVYIDDTALGCPRKYSDLSDLSKRWYVDWYKVAKYLTIIGAITEQQFASLKYQ